MERVQCPLGKVVLETPIKALELSGGQVLRITGTDLEFSPVLTKVTYRHTPPPLSEQQSDCPEACSKTVPSPHTSLQAGEGLASRRLQKGLVMAKSFGVRVI